MEPEFCDGAQNRISSATGDGRSLGLDGSSFYPGQVITGPPKTRVRLADASVIELENGGRFGIEKCQEDETSIGISASIGRFWTHVKKAASADRESGGAAAGARAAAPVALPREGRALGERRRRRRRGQLGEPPRAHRVPPRPGPPSPRRRA